MLLFWWLKLYPAQLFSVLSSLVVQAAPLWGGDEGGSGLFIRYHTLDSHSLGSFECVLKRSPWLIPLTGGRTSLQPFLCLKSFYLAINQFNVCSGQCEELLKKRSQQFPLWHSLFPNISAVDARCGIPPEIDANRPLIGQKPTAKPLQHLL